MRIWAIGLILVLTQVACAESPGISERTVARSTGSILQSSPAISVETQGARGGLFSSIRPLFRSRKVEKQTRAQRRLLAQGAVCGDLAIQGEVVGAVPGRISGCGIENAVRVRSVSGIGLSQQAVMDCETAAALKSWVDGSVKPALAKKGGGLKRLRVAAHYVCRTRNHKKGAKISEHGKGRAIDISAFRLQDGSQITVQDGWRARAHRKAMRQMHKGACGPFGTVLGPDADRYHQSHFYLDTARYRSGSYCR